MEMVARTTALERYATEGGTGMGGGVETASNQPNGGGDKEGDNGLGGGAGFGGGGGVGNPGTETL